MFSFQWSRGRAAQTVRAILAFSASSLAPSSTEVRPAAVLFRFKSSYSSWRPTLVGTTPATYSAATVGPWARFPVLSASSRASLCGDLTGVIGSPPTRTVSGSGSPPSSPGAQLECGTRRGILLRRPTHCCVAVRAPPMKPNGTQSVPTRIRACCPAKPDPEARETENHAAR